MVVGKYEHNMDNKNRVFAPAKFREAFPQGFYYKYVSSSKCPAIRCFSKEDFEAELENALDGLVDEYDIRIATYSVCLGVGECTYDKLGRVIIDADIAKKAELKDKCVFVGCVNYFEILSPENYAELFGFIDEERKADEDATRGEREVYRRLKKEGKLIKLPNQSV